MTYSIILVFQELNVLLEQKNIQMQVYVVVTQPKKTSQTYGEIVSCFRHMCRNNILQPYITQNFSKSLDKYILSVSVTR